MPDGESSSLPERPNYGEGVYDTLRKIELAERYMDQIEADRDRLRDTLTEVGKWMSGGDFAGWENVLAEIERTLDADQ